MPDPIMSFQVVKVTPELATEWLQANTRNRGLNDRTVRDYVRAMESGLWTLNGEAVKRAIDGTLLDGQHRLEAIRRSGISVEMLVVDGLPLQAQDTMDTGRRRTTSDVLAIRGVTNAAVVGAICRRVWQWEAGNDRFTNTQNPAPTELAKVLDRYPSIHRSAQIAVQTWQSFRPTKRTVSGTAHHIFNRIDPDTCARFFAHFMTGADLADGHPILALRTRIMSDRVTGKGNPFHVDVALHIRAWNAYREGRTLNRIPQGPGDAMPKPV